METEVLCPPDYVRTERGLSAALLPQAPRRVTITTQRGHDVPLTLTGYRLRLGNTYCLRVAGPVKEIRLVGFPRLLVRRRGEPREVVDNGVHEYCQAISVSSAGFWSMLTHLGIYPEELEVEAVLPDGRKVTAVIPVILELGFTLKIALLLVLWALVGSAFELIAAAVSQQRSEILTSPVPWIKGLGVALLYPVLTFIRRTLGLRQRARELQQQFQTHWSEAQANDLV